MRERFIKKQRTFIKRRDKAWYADSPYWDWAFHVQNNRTENSDFYEPLEANPDSLSSEVSMYDTLWSPYIHEKQLQKFKALDLKRVLTEQQYLILAKYLELMRFGHTKTLSIKVSRALKIKPQIISKQREAIRKKLQKYLFR